MCRSAWAIGIGVALIPILFVGVSLMGSWGWGGGYGWSMMGGPGMMRGWWGVPLLGPIFGLVLVGLIIAGTIWFVQALGRDGSRTGGATPGGETAMEILKRRYASGEFSKEQFEEMKRSPKSHLRKRTNLRRALGFGFADEFLHHRARLRRDRPAGLASWDSSRSFFSSTVKAMLSSARARVCSLSSCSSASTRLGETAFGSRPWRPLTLSAV